LKSAQAENLFSSAVSHFNNREFAQATSILRQLADRNEKPADVHHLLALMARQQGRLLEAVSLFKKSLSYAPNQPVVLSNFGNLLRDLQRHGEAEECYRSALKLMPSLVDCWYNRGTLAIQRYQYDLAEQCFSEAIKLSPQPRSFLGLGRIRLEKQPLSIEDTNMAMATARSMQQKFPKDPQGYTLEARALFLAGDIDRAEARLREALELVDDRAVILFELGAIAVDANRVEQAIDYLKSSVEEKPDLIEAHRLLNEILWEHERDEFLTSYHRALQQKPDYAPLYHNLAAAYISSGSEKEASRTLDFAVERLGRDPFLLHGLGVQAAKRGSADVALGFYEEALREAPDNIQFLLDRVALSIGQGDHAEADRHLQHALSISPDNQLAWAYQGLIWRLSGDARYEWLFAYDKLLREIPLSTPAGFSSIEVFMGDLATYLESLHRARRQPLDQSVRLGTQTTGILLNDPHELIRGLRAAISSATTEFLAPLEADQKHPFLRRLRPRDKAWRFSGSWSVRLSAQGHHSNHVHPNGWLSCCTYVALPLTEISDSNKKSGWIKFGETSLKLGEREEVARAIQPKLGHCVFFPGYFWHGTIPFSSVEKRLTVPCDIDPL
jgi:tetratricopeptide (TPR) repeat protein